MSQRLNRFYVGNVFVTHIVHTDQQPCLDGRFQLLLQLLLNNCEVSNRQTEVNADFFWCIKMEGVFFLYLKLWANHNVFDFTVWTSEFCVADNEAGGEDALVGNVNKLMITPPGYTGPPKKGHVIFDACFESGKCIWFFLVPFSPLY